MNNLFYRWLLKYGDPIFISQTLNGCPIIYETEEYVYLQSLLSFKPVSYRSKTGKSGTIPPFPKWPILAKVSLNDTNYTGRYKVALKVDKNTYYECIKLLPKPIQTIDW